DRLGSQIEGVDSGGLGPTFDRDLAVAGVDGDDHPTGEGVEDVVEEIGLFDGQGADDHLTHSFINEALAGGQVTDAAPQLEGQADGDDSADGAAIFGTAGKGAVEIDDVDARGSSVGKGAGHIGGMVGVDGGALAASFDEADHLAAHKIDSGDDQHRQSTKARS